MSAEIHDDVIVASERVHARPEVVFPYFTDPVLISRWLCDRAELDPQPEGGLFLDMGQIAVRGTYLAVEAPYRVAFTWGVPGDTSLPPGASRVEVVLTPDGEDTIVVLTHRQLPAGELDRHRAGWAGKLSALDAAAR